MIDHFFLFLLILFYVSGELQEDVTEFYDTDGTPVHMIVSGSVMVTGEMKTNIKLYYVLN